MDIIIKKVYQSIISKQKLYIPLVFSLLWLFIVFFLLPSYPSLTYLVSKPIIDRTLPIESKNIVLVSLDEKTLNTEGFKRYQEIWRYDYAKVIKNILTQNPSLVVVDIYFSQNSTDSYWDDELYKLAKNTKVVFSTETNKWAEENSLIFNNKWIIFQKWYVDITKTKTIPFDSWNFFWTIPWYDSWSSLSQKAFEVKNPNISIKSWDKSPLPIFGPFETYSFWDVLLWKTDSSVFSWKTVFIWATAKDIHDTLPTVYSQDLIPWVFMHIAWYLSLYGNKNVNFAPFLWYFILILIYSYLVSLYTNKHKIFRLINFLYLTLVMTLISMLSLWLFSYFIDILVLITSSFIVLVFFLVKDLFFSLIEKRFIINAFSKYVSPSIIDEIIDEWLDSLCLWGKTVNITVYFSDIAWFTDISEKLSPEDLGLVLNIYLSEMTNIIIKNWWTVGKYIGDAIMAFWNAPVSIEEHAKKACITVIEQNEALKIVNEKIKHILPEWIKHRIWLNTGPAIVWNFWSDLRFDYTAIWDNVNLSARLESINKKYGSYSLISEATLKSIWNNNSNILFRLVDRICVKWKNNATSIYEICWLKSSIDKNQEDIYSTYNKWLESYFSWNFNKAIEIFNEIEKFDATSKKMKERCEWLLLKPPLSWDWIWRFEDK